MSAGCSRIILNLECQYRFSAPVAQFLSNTFYDKKLSGYRRQQDRNETIRGFGLYHLERNDLGWRLVEQIMSLIPTKHRIAIVSSDPNRRKLNQKIR